MTAHGLRVAEAPAPYRVAPLLTDHLDTFASAPEGFKRLRELVLNLAVRGRLVPQDPKDEPATEAILRSASARSISGAKASKTRPRSVKESPPYNLPNGWVWVRLAELTRVLNGRAYAKEELLDSGTPVLRVGNLFTSNHWYYSNLALEHDKYCDVGDLLFSWSASFGPFIWKGPRVIYHYHIWKLDLYSEACLSKDYLYTFLVEKTAEIKAAGHGVSMVHMTKEKMEQIFVPVPPLAEQSRIVAKVEELMALIDALEAKVGAGETARGRLLDALLAALAASPDAAATAEAWAQFAPHVDLLLQTPADVDRLQQTLLQLAVKGRLVPQDPNDEPATELLKRIHAEKARLVAGGKIKRDKPLPVIDEDDQPYQLPQGWHWLRLGDAVTKMDAGWSPACEDEAVTNGSNWAVLKTTAVQVLEFRQYENKRLPAKLVPRPDCETEAGDILITRAGPKNRVGISCLVERVEPKLMISDKIIRFHPVEQVLNPKFVSLCLNAGASARHIEAAKSGMAESQMNISQADLRRAPIPICPLAEQSRIVAAVASLTALCDRLRERLTARRALSAQLAAALTESALA